MPTPRRSILSQLFVTTLTALTVVALYLYLTRPRQEHYEQSLIQRHMDRTISVNFNDTRLDDALRSLSEQTGIPIKADWPKLATLPIVPMPTLATLSITPDHQVTLTLNDVPARAALDVLLRQIANDAPILWTERDDHVLVSDPSVLTPVVRIYDVDDLVNEYITFRNSMPSQPYTPIGQGLFAAAELPLTATELRERALEELLGVLVQFTDIDSWIDNGGTVGQIVYSMNRLAIGQTLENHDQIQRLLAAMRARGPEPVSSPAEPRNHP